MPRPLPLLLALALMGTAHAQDVAYPNPVAGPTLTVETADTDAVFEVYDVLGRRLEARSPLAPGVYLWRLLRADGTRTHAQPLTKLTTGPIEVHLFQGDRAARPGLGTAAQEARAEREGCRVAAPVFGGFQFEPRRGSNLEIEQTANVTRTGAYASSVTCLGGVGGVGMRFPGGASPWKIEEGLSWLFEATVTGTPSGAGLAPLQIPVTLKTISGNRGDLRLGLDASSPKLVEVIDVAPDGTETVVASTVVPAGTPITRRLARISAPGGSGFELTEFSAQNHRYTDQLLDSLWHCHLGFGTDAPGGVTVQINGATVQGDVIRVTAPLDRRIMFETFQLETTGPGYQIDDVGFIAYGHEGGTGFAPSTEGRLLWLRTADPVGLMTADGSTMEVRCARGATCATYGVQASSSLFTTSAAGTEVDFSGLTTGPGRGLLFGTGGQVDVSMVYVAEVPSGATGEGEAMVTLQTPPSSRSVVVDFQVVSGPPITDGEARYVRDGVVRRQFSMTPGDPVDLGLRVELTDAQITTAPDGSILLVFTDVVRQNSQVEIELSGPPVSDYLKITMENIARWSFEGVATTASGSPQSVMAGR